MFFPHLEKSEYKAVLIFGQARKVEHALFKWLVPLDLEKFGIENGFRLKVHIGVCAHVGIYELVTDQGIFFDVLGYHARIHPLLSLLTPQYYLGGRQEYQLDAFLG